MLGILNGQIYPTSGELVMSAKNIGMGFQSAQIYMDITVRENLKVFTEMMDADQEWVDYLIEKLRLETEMHRKGKALSGGNAKKLDLTLAFMKKPDLVLLDEPLADLDDATRAGLKEVIKEYPNEDRAIVIASHNLEELEDVITHMTLIEKGDILKDIDVSKSSEDLYSLYRKEIIG